MVGDDKPVYLEYDMPDADFIKKKNEEEDEEKNPSDDEMSICSIQSIDPELKAKLTEAVSYLKPMQIPTQKFNRIQIQILIEIFRESLEETQCMFVI